MKAVYQIPLISQDLRQEENIIQIADVLDHLNNVINDVFTKLNSRIEENMKRTKAIQSRINICNDKVNRLTGTNKATRVVCSAKYPAMECHKNIQVVFKETAMGDVVRTHRDIKTKPVVYSEKELQDKLEYYHVKVNCQDPAQAILENSLPRNHDSPPAQLRAVGCLMVYGSEEAVYGGGGRGVGGGVQAAKEAIERGPPSPLHEPPATVATRDTHSRGHHLYLYSPNLEEVPTMDMPQDLPHLSGVAGDMRFQLESEPTIAPSARVQSMASSPVTSIVEQKRVQNSDGVTEKEQMPSTVKQVTEEPQPKVVEEKVVTQSTAPPMAPPPPPPPPPPVPPVEETDSKDTRKMTEKSKETAPQPVSLDNRANLMEAIRKAGGSGKARLRSVTVTATKQDNTKMSSTSSVGGSDLMADLHAKLSMRRKGISGTRQGGGAEGTILSALSAIIPPPPDADPQSNSEVSSTEDDWD